MNRGALTVNKLNLTELPYKVLLKTGGVWLALVVIQVIVVSTGGSKSKVLIGMCYFLLLIIPIAVISVTDNLYKFINLGGKRRNFFEGCIITYVILALCFSFLNTAIYYIFDVFIKNLGYFPDGINFFEYFTWSSHGMIVGFLQQSAFFLLIFVFVNAFILIFDMHLGTVFVYSIAAVFAAYSILAKPTGGILSGFFYIFIANPNALLQIIPCLVLSVLIYPISLPLINRKSL